MNLLAKFIAQQIDNGRLWPEWGLELADRYALKVTPSPCGRRASIKYDQIRSPMSDPLVAQCRGVVVDTTTGRTCARPYDKFWNLGERMAASIDWATAHVMEKIDGSLMILYWDERQAEDEAGGGWCPRPEGAHWRVATSGHPTAGGRFGTAEESFAVAFWSTWFTEGMKLPADSLSGNTFMFEMCAPETRIVVPHTKRRLVLHGIRSNESGAIWARGAYEIYGKSLGWEVVRTFPVRTTEEVLAAANALDGAQQEGFVIRDADGRQVKVKSPRYVALHHMKGEFSSRRAIELWQAGETGEVAAVFPELAGVITATCDKLTTAALRALVVTRALLEAPITQKDFAIVVASEPWSAIAFRLKRAHADNGYDALTPDLAIATARDLTTASLETMLERMWHADRAEL